MKAKKNPARAFSVALALMTVLVSCGEGGNPDEIIMRCDSDSDKKLIKSMVLRTADRQGMC